MRNRARKNYVIYVLMLLLFGGLIYVAIEEGDRFSHYAVNAQNMVQGNPFTMFLQFIQDNLHHPLTTLLIQIIAVLLMVRLFGYLFSLIGQPGSDWRDCCRYCVRTFRTRLFLSGCFSFPFSGTLAYQSLNVESGGTDPFLCLSSVWSWISVY